MNVCYSLLCFTITLPMLSDGTAAEPNEPVAIPLDQIWAWRMPGTKSVRTLDAVKIGGATEHPILHDIFGGIGSLPRGEKAARAFVVEGVGKPALENASAVFRKEERRAEVMPANTELSLVFYSHSSARRVHLVAVEKSERLITVKYRFFSDTLAVNRIHFALIQIGKFAPGVVEVKIEQQSSTDLAGSVKPPIREMERLVSGAFAFEVHQ